MTVTVDAVTENVRTGTTSPQTFSHAAAASGVKGVVLAIVHGTSSTDHVTAASYGGVALTRKQRNVDTATEPGAAEWWFLGSGVPQGTQTVSYTPGATTDDIHAVVITLLGDRDIRVIDTDGISENVANPSVTLQYAGYSAMAFAALYGGGAAPTSFTENANCTRVHDQDLGAFYSAVCRQTTAGSSDFAIGGTSGTDDVAFAAIAVTDAEATGSIAQTDTRDTASASGLVTVTGTVASTDTRDIAAASGLVTVTGSIAQTDTRDTAAASGTVESGAITGTVAVTDGRDSAAASGLVAVTGSIAQTDTRDTAAASGTVEQDPVTSTVAAADGRDSASATGTVDSAAPAAEGWLLPNWSWLYAAMMSTPKQQAATKKKLKRKKRKKREEEEEQDEESLAARTAVNRFLQQAAADAVERAGAEAAEHARVTKLRQRRNAEAMFLCD